MFWVTESEVLDLACCLGIFKVKSNTALILHNSIRNSREYTAWCILNGCGSKDYLFGENAVLIFRITIPGERKQGWFHS